MTESYSVQSRLTISTNVESVLRQLIEQFETLDKVVKDSQEVITNFAKETKELGKAGGTSLKEAFEGLKIPQSVLSDLSKVSEFGKGFATSSAEAAAAWKEIAAASKSIRNQAPTPGGSGSGSGGGEGGGRRGGGGRSGGGGSGGGSGDGGIFGTSEQRANARWQDSDFDARSSFQQKLLADEQKAVLSEISMREKAEANRAKVEAKLLADEQKAVMASIAMREKTEAERDKVERELLEAERKAVLNQIAIRERDEAADRQARMKRNEAIRGDKGDVYGPLPFDQAIQGRKGERAAAEAEDAWITANERAKAAAAARAKKYDEESNYGLKGHHDLATAGMGFQMAGQAGTSYLEKAIMSNFEFEHNMARVTGNNNIANDPELLKNIRAAIQSVARSTPGMTQVDVSEIFQDLQTAFGDPKEALAELPAFSKLVNSLQLGDMHHGGSGEMHQALAMARFIEDQGGAIDPKTGLYTPERFDELAQRAVSIAFATNFRVRPTEMLAFQKTGRTGGMMMNDHALYEETPYYAQQLGASKLGTSIFSEAQVMLGGRLDKAHLNYMTELGLIPKSAVREVGKGRDKHMEYDSAQIKDRQLLAEDPFKWIHDVLGKMIAEHYHIDTNTKHGQQEIAIELTKAAQRGTIAGMWADVFRNYEVAQKEGRNIAAQNPDMQAHMLKEDPLAQIKVFQAAENEFMVALGDLLKGPAVSMLKDLVVGLHGLSDWVKENKDLAKTIAIIVGGGAALSQAFGGLAMAMFFAKPMIGAIAALGGGIARLAAALIPFGAGGSAAAGLAGLEAGAAKTAAAAGAKGTMSTLGPLGLVGLGVAGGAAGAYKSGKDIADHAAIGETPMMMDDFGNPIGYYKPNRPGADSLVKPQSSTKGSNEDPLHVIVQNQVSGDDIARGTTARQSSKMNRAPSGYTGADTRMDPLGAFYGMVTSPN